MNFISLTTEIIKPQVCFLARGFFKFLSILFVV